MSYRRPLLFREALATQAARAVLPTTLGSADIERIDADLLRRSQFSAKVADVVHLDELNRAYTDVLAGNIDVATARLRVKQYLWRTGYEAPPDKQGGLEDLASTRRVNLQIDTNVEMMRGAGAHLQGQDEAILDMYPAQELVRVIDSKVPRDWNQRWLDAGGPKTSLWPRMIAPKDHPVWTHPILNRFGNAYPPLDYNSGMGFEDRSRREAMRLGLIDLNRKIEPDREALRDLAAGSRASLAIGDERLRAALEATGVGRFDAEGVFVQAGDDEGGPLLNREFARDENGRFAKTNAIAAGNAAVEKALATKADVLGAMEREDIGPIDFRWGNDRMGLAHVKARGDARNAKFKDGIDGEAILRKMPAVIAEGQITQRGSRTLTIEHEGYRVTLGNQWKGKPSKHWVLSGYDLSEQKKGNR